jgi:hypothetical protein
VIDHTDAQDLLAVHALDALEADEVALLEEHLETCPRCRAELIAYREVAGILGDAGAPAPSGLWDRIADSLEETPPVLSLEHFRAPSQWVSKTSRRRRVLGALAAAAIVIVAVLAIDVVRLRDRTTHTQVAAAAEPTMSDVAAALATPGARQSELRSPTGNLTSRVVVLPGGSGYLYDSTLPRLPGSQTYQLWGISMTKVVSYGLLGSDPSVVAFRAGSGAIALAVTEEKAGGVVASAHKALITGSLRYQA